MGLLTKYSGLQKRKTMARSMAINRRNKYHKSLMPTDIILPTTSLTANTMKNEEVIRIDSKLWDALMLEVEVHLDCRNECTVDQLATVLKSSKHLATIEANEKAMDQITGKLQNMSITNAVAGIRQGLTKLEQAPQSQERRITTVAEAMEVLKTVFVVKERLEEEGQGEKKKYGGSFMGLREYVALVSRSVSSQSIKGLKTAHQRLRGIAMASSKKRDGTEQSTLGKSDAELKDIARKEYEESQLRAMPKSVRDEERVRIAEAERVAEARESAALLLRPLTSEEKKKVEDAIYGNGRPDDILCRVGTDSVRRESMHRLRPGQWLNDEVIHYFYVMLANRDEELGKNDPSRKPSHFFKSFFITKLLNEGHADPTMNGKYEYRQVKRWSKNVPGKDLFALEKIFFPINQGNSHWICAVAFMSEKRIQMFDSLGGSGRPYLEAIFQYLKDDHKDKKKCEMPDQDEWELVVTQPDTPNQQNGYDCGVFTCMFADFLSKDCPLVFSQEHVTQCRERIALSIMNGSALQ